MSRHTATHSQPNNLYDIFEEDLDAVPSSAFVDTVSADGRRVSRTRFTFFTPPSPTRKHAQPLPSCDNDEFLPWDSTPMEPTSSSRKQGLPRRDRYNTTEHDTFLSEWLPERDKFLSELLRLDGLRGYSDVQCPACSNTPANRPQFRCKDCDDGELLCRECCVAVHARNPFHQIMRWNSQFFEKTTLQNLGYVLQLGHPPGRYCPSPQAAPVNFLVIHTTGIHPMTVYYCGCSQLQHAGSHVDQLLRRELYPATVVEPATCFTFRLLDQFCVLTHQSKLTAYDYAIGVQLLTDMNGIGPTTDRMKVFLRVAREWRHLKWLKRAGRGHDLGGVNATKAGELCLRCPACPRPGYNLPSNWKTASDNIRFIYTMFVAIDANFRLKRRAISTDARDPALGSGWGYFVEDRAYRQHILRHADEQDISTCTGFAALLHANTKFSKGYATTGVGAAICARHGFFLPNGVGDLQKGERYCNMDYIIASTLSLTEEHPLLLLSYDIMCQWIKNLKDRISKFPPHLRIELPVGEVRYAIPKYHFNAHKEKGHNQYSLNLMTGVGRSDCEEIERGWARHDGIASSTREMGPGSRHDTIEFHMEFSNHRKYVGMGQALLKQYVRSRRESRTQDAIFKSFSERLSSANVDEWTKLAIAYDKDPTGPDPYYREVAGLTEAEIRLQLAEEDEQAAEEGDASLHEVTPASMLVELLDIEDQQRKFRLKYPSVPENTGTQYTGVASKRAALRRRINNIQALQAIYMPCVPRLIASERLSRHASAMNNTTTVAARSDVGDLPEHQKLFLPHQIPPAELEACTPALAETEERLREAQMHDSLDKLRVQLHVKSRLVTFKDRNVRHQRPNTRARRKLDTNDTKIIVFAEKYRAARRAKLALSGPGEWERVWKVLEKSDVRTLSSEDDPVNCPDDGPSGGVSSVALARKRGRQHLTEGRRTTSWIWMAADAEGDEASSLRGMHDALRVEFFRARARSLRYQEDIVMVLEEQRRTLVSLEATAVQWERRAVQAFSEDAIRNQGAAAYAVKQAAIQRRLAEKFRTIWGTQDNDPAPRKASAPVEPDGEFDDESSSDDEDLYIVDDATWEDDE